MIEESETICEELRKEVIYMFQLAKENSIWLSIPRLHNTVVEDCCCNIAHCSLSKGIIF